MLLPRGVSTAQWIRNNFGRAGDLPNVITHAKCEINWYQIVTTADAINTAKPCQWLINQNL